MEYPHYTRIVNKKATAHKGKMEIYTLVFYRDKNWIA